MANRLRRTAGGDKFRGKPKYKCASRLFPNITHSQALIGKADGSFQKALGDSYKIEKICQLKI